MKIQTKKKTLVLATALYAMLAFSGAAFAEDKPATETRDKDAAPAQSQAKDKDEELPTRNSLPRPTRNSDREVEVSYLGVSAGPVPAAVSSQLKLQQGFGLLVAQVMEGSPAAQAGFQENDVLVKLDDQRLIEANQLLVLVRSMKPGDDVTMTYIRGGETKTVTVKIGKRMVPRSSLADTMHDDRMLIMRRDMMDRMRNSRPNPVPFTSTGRGQGSGNIAFEDMNPGALPFSRTVIRDGDTRIELETGAEGKNTFVVRDSSGKELFRGAASTKEERDKIPSPYREKLERIESIRLRVVPVPPSPTTAPGPQPFSQHTDDKQGDGSSS